MKKICTILFLISFAISYGQTHSKTCLCSESQIKTDTKPDTIFYLQNGIPISFCGYKFNYSQPVVYLKFILAFCLPDTLLHIDIWNANQSCHIRTIGDTLLVDDIDTKFTEKIYLRGLSIIRKTVKTKTTWVSKKEAPIKTVERIFKEYIKQSENIDALKNKEAMKIALQLLQSKSDNKNLPLLINVWMYYDPTDFPTRQIIQKIFEEDRKASLTAINYRLKNKMKSENKEIAPYSDLLLLRNELTKRQM